MSTGVVRVPEHVLLESRRVAALKGQQPGALLAAAWREYLDNHRAEFAEDLEEAARLLRDGTLQDLSQFVSRNADDRAAVAAAAARAEPEK
jgi:hypothetical protein